MSAALGNLSKLNCARLHDISVLFTCLLVYLFTKNVLSMFTFKQFTIDDSACAMKVGTDGVLLGAGREVAGAPVDHAVGLEVLHKIGDRVEKGEALFKVAYRDENKCEAASKMLLDAIQIGGEKPQANLLIRDIRR